MTTSWVFRGLFFGGEEDEAGTPIGDICTGCFLTSSDSVEEANRLLAARYVGLSGEFICHELKAILPAADWNSAMKKAHATRLARIWNRGGTKSCPVLR